MNARDDIAAHFTSDTLAKQLLDAHRAEVFAEAIAALQGLHDINPNGRRAPQLAFAIGALLGTRDFPGEVPSGGGIAVNPFTDQVYRDAYATGRDHAGAKGWLFENFEAVAFTNYGPSDSLPANEYRCRKCGAIGGQGTGVKSLLDLMAMAARHECLPRVTDAAEDGAE